MSASESQSSQELCLKDSSPSEGMLALQARLTSLEVLVSICCNESTRRRSSTWVVPTCIASMMTCKVHLLKLSATF